MGFPQKTGNCVASGLNTLLACIYWNEEHKHRSFLNEEALQNKDFQQITPSIEHGICSALYEYLPGLFLINKTHLFDKQVEVNEFDTFTKDLHITLLSIPKGSGSADLLYYHSEDRIRDLFFSELNAAKKRFDPKLQEKNKFIDLTLPEKAPLDSAFLNPYLVDGSCF